MLLQLSDCLEDLSHLSPLSGASMSGETKAVGVAGYIGVGPPDWIGAPGGSAVSPENPGNVGASSTRTGTDDA